MSLMVREIQNLVLERNEYERNDALEGVIECNGELSEKRMLLKKFCNDKGIPFPKQI
ncbi:hypothetical protein MK292_06125 [Myxococcota bacterium]|nr:hypothetical protein [Myxococcota bacterium]